MLEENQTTENLPAEKVEEKQLKTFYAYSNDGTGFRMVDETTPDLQPNEVIFENEATPDELRAAFPNYDKSVIKADAFSKMLDLEQTITDRRLREAIASPNKVVIEAVMKDGVEVKPAVTASQWLANIQNEIETERAKTK